MEIPAINLKAILLIHWLLTVWGCMNVALTSAYAWSNFSVLAVGVWAVAQRDSIDAIIMFLIGMTVTIVTDIIFFSIFFPLIDNLIGLVRFTMGMAIFSLILKPVSCFFIYQMYHERGGDYNINFGFPTVTRNRDTYQSIDQQDQRDSSAKPFNQGDGLNHAGQAY